MLGKNYYSASTMSKSVMSFDIKSSSNTNINVLNDQILFIEYFFL